MILVRIRTLIVSGPQGPSVVVLQPENEVGNSKSRVVPIWMGFSEANQLGIAIDRAKTKRPMTHDLFLDALTNLDARIDHTVITDFEKNVFQAKLVIRQGQRLVELDARPSDAIALAVRQDAPVFLESSVLEKASYPFITRTTESQEDEIVEFRTFLEEIAPEDFGG